MKPNLVARQQQGSTFRYERCYYLPVANGRFLALVGTRNANVGPMFAHGTKETAAMSTVPVKQSPDTGPTESMEGKFRRLADVWRAETAYTSSSSDLVSHPAFQEIVSMGPAVIPLLLRELENRTGHWHRALRRITGVDPVPPAERGNLAKTAAAWLGWGKEQGYQW